MVGPKAMGFSLLSRGVGQREGEKMEVKLESADYYNWINDPSRVFLPPIHISKLETPRRVEPVSLKKTFTTRKGALLLFSEDFAVKEEDEKGKDEKAADSEPLKVEDFAKCVLSYGDRSSPELGGEHVYLKFVHHRRDKLRAVRPGFSAKRYIASWSKTADDNFIAKLTTAGAILDSTLYESNLFLPHLKHRVGTDLSHYPAPYRLMRDMLMSPGEVSGYTFLWQPHDSSREMTSDENGVMYPSGRSPSLSQGSIKVMRQDTKGEMHEVEYSDLDENTKESVLTELLLKSAISHALQKTEEAMEKAMSGSRPNSVVQELAEAFAIDAPPNTASPKSESPAKSPDKLDLRKDSIKIPAGHSPDAGMFVVTSRRPSHESRTSRSDSPKSKKTSSSPTKGNESPTTVRSHRTTKSDSTKKSDSDRLGADSPGKKSTSSKSSGLSVPRVVIKPHLDLGGIPKAEEPRAPSTHSRSGSTPSSTRGSPSKQPKRQSPTLQPGQPGSPTVAAKTPKVTMIGGPFGIAEEEEDGFEEAPRGPVFVKPTASKKVTSNKPRGPGLSRQASQPGGMGLVKFDMKEAVETMLSEPPKPDEGIIKQAQQAAKQETRQQEMVMEDMGTKARAPFARKIRGGALTSGGTVQGNVQDMKAQQGSLFPTLDEAPKSEYKPKLQKRATASTTFPPIEENQKVTRQPGILMEVAEPAPPTMTAGEARIRRLQSEADERERKTSHEEKSEGGHPASLARGDSTLQSVTEDDVMSVKKPKRKRIERPSSTTVFEEATGRVKHFTSRISMDDSEADLIEARTRRQKLRKILREQSAFIPDHIRKLQERPVRTMSAGDARPLSGSRGPGARQDKPITLADLALPPGLDKVIKLMQDEEERNPNAFSNKRRALVNRQGVPQRSSSRADLLKKGMDGSLLMAPDGDVIKIGQTIQPESPDIPLVIPLERNEAPLLPGTPLVPASHLERNQRHLEPGALPPPALPRKNQLVIPPHPHSHYAVLPPIKVPQIQLIDDASSEISTSDVTSSDYDVIDDVSRLKPYAPLPPVGTRWENPLLSEDMFFDTTSLTICKSPLLERPVSERGRLRSGRLDFRSAKSDISDPSTWKHLTKEQLIEKLRKHAAEIAARVLKGGGGKDLAADARLAADIWTENYTERSKTFIEGLEKSETESSITDSVQQTLQAQMLGQLLANFKNLEDIAEFKDVLLQTLGNIVSSLTGMNIVLPADAEISEELLRALANQDLDPEDIEVYVDPITGKTYVRLRKKGQKPTPMVERKLGDVVIPAGVDIDDELAAMLAMGQYNEDDIEFVFDEKTGRRVARLKQGAVKKKPKIGGVEIPDDAVLSDDIMKALASGDLCADDLELVWDEKLGRHVVRVKSAAKNKVRTIGGVIIPKDAVIDDALAAALALGEYDADDIEYVFDEKTGKMVVRLKEGAKKKPKNIGGIEIPADAELDEEVLALLKSGNINPDDLEVFFDEATGKTIVRLKKKAQPRVLGEVEIPADVEIDAELAAMLAMGQYSADDIEFVIDEKTGKRVARLKKNAVKKPPTIAELHSPREGGVKLPDDAYIPEDILAALANSTLTADDLEVVWDEKLGRHVVRVKSAARRKKVRQLGDVFIPRDAVIDDALAAALALGEYSADDLEYIYDEKTGKTIVRLKAGAKKKPRKIGGVDIPADAEISAELLAALQAGDLTADDMELIWDEATGKMVVRLKSSYKRRMEAEERRRLNLRPLSGEKERPHFVFGKKPDDELTSLYGPYDPSKKVQYGITEVQISGQVPIMSSPSPPPPDFPSAPAPTALSDASVLVRTPKVKDATPEKQPAVKAPKKLKPKTESKKEPQAPKVKEGKGKKPKGKSKEPPSKKAKTTDDEEEEFVPRKIKPKVLKRERSGEESSDFERVPTEPETEIGKRKIKLRTDSGRSYYTEVDEDEYELEHLERETTKDSIVEIRIDSARELSVVLKDVEPEPAKPESPIFDDIEEQQQTGPFSRWLEKDEFGRPRLLSKAKAERRRREIEKKRTERELKKKQDKEDAEAAEKLQRELEEEMERKMEEARLKREQEEAERIARIEREAELEEQRHQAAERAKKLREQQKEKMEMMRKQREEEERQRREQQRLREEAEAERLRREQSMLERMGREEREEFLRKQREEQQERARQEAAENDPEDHESDDEDTRRRQMEEARRQMEEARRLAEEMMRRQKDMEQRLTFNRGLWAESTGLDRSHDVSRAFVWSYFELLQWLGLDIPSN